MEWNGITIAGLVLLGIIFVLLIQDIISSRKKN